MKLVCKQSDLNSNLSLVSRAVPSRPTHPILGNVLLTADEEKSRVLLTGFDLSMGIQTSFTANVTTGGAIAIPAKLFNDIVSRLPDGEITLAENMGESDSEDEVNSVIVTLTSKSGRYQMRGMTPDEFPELPEIEASSAIQLPIKALTEGFRGSLFATSADETKQVLTGVHLIVDRDKLEFAATDGHRLAVVENTNWQGEDGEEDEEEESSQLNLPFELTLPARALRELERMLGMRQSSDSTGEEVSSTVALKFEEGQIVFQSGDHRLTSRTLEGQYPAYRQLLPSQFEHQIQIDRRNLLSAVERIAVLADQKNNVVKFSIDSLNQTIDLSVEAQDVGSGTESMSAEISGESLDIAFNVKYLIDGLKALSTSHISLEMNSANSPVIITPIGGTKMTYLIMPVQIRT
ncbi:MAG TPA: DNA polymerase III subunit beta [Cyanobacteria bacterium UBA11149]|nr:DNA polymerase III subunit beta [Cyanobacteria bacterium UBA11367]HBE58920.1 DNA polymerase III subunit beta [Cyanobacteria bacterium UBA11366]HBK63761.1 DNA polymerase III subunit beta [Cyanobacteria bacterium UBA11166]HBR75650.1 DNA polymerase III subunit beta [Cyanobacteria bacterium UBA11159]HBS70949.1 DNA polymerase III subunit beta [Cyanobacteria bacterium UBA11153]HBW87426.1 DNA polymerase III subunit beta [Cyanobacteria bacterium UBA11149]HCA97259.1 DNA polymerase III subunit beta 